MMYWKFVGQKHCALICGSLQSTYFYGYTQWPLVWSTNVTSGRILQVFAEPQRANNDSHAQVDIRSYGDALFVLRDLGLGNPMGFCVKKLPNFQTQITLSWLMLVIFMYNICIICILYIYIFNQHPFIGSHQVLSKDRQEATFDQLGDWESKQIREQVRHEYGS